MIGLPSSLLDLSAARRYCAGESACAWAAEDRVVLELNSDEADGFWEEDAEGSLASIVPAAPSWPPVTCECCTWHGCSRWGPRSWRMTT